MKANYLPTPSMAAVAIAMLLGTADCLAADSVAESFDRMLTHAPVRGVPLASFRSDVDPLVAALVVPLRDGVQPRGSAVGAAAPADPVAQSFERLFAHRPTAMSSSVPARFGADPLHVAMVEPLRDSLARSAATTNHAERVARPSGAVLPCLHTAQGRT
jgi:hypothetical protein